MVIELAGDAGFSRDLAAGGVFVPGCALRLAEECDLVVRGANRELVVPARVVYVDELRGAGLELIGFSSELKAQLAELEPLAGASLEFLEVPAIDELLPDGSPLDDPPPPDDDFALGGFGGFSEPFPLTDLQALDDAPDDEDDLAVPLAGDPGGYPRDAEPVPGEAGDADPVPGEAGDADPVPGEAGGGDPHAAAFDGDPHAAAYDDAGQPYDDAGQPAHRRAAIYDAVEVGNLADLDPSNPDYAYLTNAKTLPPEDLARYIPTRASRAQADGQLVGQLEDEDPLDHLPDRQLEHPLDGEPEGPPDEQAEGQPGRRSAGRDTGSMRRVAPGVHERLRGLTLASQLKVAVSGEQHERIVLERLYGKNVWEALLRNPRLTAPEVARIARYGALPRVLLEIILGNNAWLQIPEVRRALLSNPRLGTDQVMKVLRLTPKHELKLAAIQTAYPHTVRQAAKQLLRSD